MKDESSTPRTICLKDVKAYPASPATLDLRTVEGDAGLRVVGIEENWSSKNIGELWFAATQCAKVVWYNAKYPTPDGFYIIVR